MVTHTSATPLSPNLVGARLKPRFGAAGDLVPFVGTARFEWGFFLNGLDATQIKSAWIQGFAPVLITLRKGHSLRGAPIIRNGNSVGFELQEMKCASTAPPVRPADVVQPQRPNNLERGFSVRTSSGTGAFEAWTDPATARSQIYYRNPAAGSATFLFALPLKVLAIGALADPHGASQALTVLGIRKDQSVLALGFFISPAVPEPK
jgi:hypothetical protein